MRRLFAALIVVTVAFTLAGCGGDGGETPVPPAVTATGTVPSGGGGGTVAEGINLSSNVGGYPTPFPTDPAYVPEDVLELLRAKQPMLIFFQDTTREVTDDQKAEIAPLMTEYRGLLDLVEFDIADGFGDGSEDSTEADTAGDELQRGVLLAQYFGILSTPYLIMVDREGTVTWKFRGWVDEGTIEREILYATQ